MNNPRSKDWAIFIVLSLIWGSSFILIKGGLENLNPYQVASLRIIFAGLVLIPLAIKGFKEFTPRQILFSFITGLLGNLLPAYLFAIAETEVESALAGMLNALTPIFTILIGAIFFGAKTPWNKWMGIFLAFGGSILLFLSKNHSQINSGYFYLGLIVLATIFYGLNGNFVSKNLKGLPILHVAGIALFLCAIPAFVVLIFSGYFSNSLLSKPILMSTLWSAILGIFGSALATYLYYYLIKFAGVIFSAMVTYAIPFVAILWGIWYGESIGYKEILSLIVILGGVFLANLKFKK